MIYLCTYLAEMIGNGRRVGKEEGSMRQRIETSIGVLWAQIEDGILLRLHFKADSFAGESSSKNDQETARALLRWVDDYFSGRIPPAPPFSIQPRGTTYQRRVWRFTQEIPYGQTLSYRALAERAGGSPRSVGGALSKNPLLLLIPCHRIVREDGTCGGYVGGLEKKKWLLHREVNRAR